jgi:hypothetical protein
MPDDGAVSLDRTTAEWLVYEGIIYWPSRGRTSLGGFQYRYIGSPSVPYRRQQLAGLSRSVRQRQQKGPRPLLQRALLRIGDLLAGADVAHLEWLRSYTRTVYDPQAYDTLATALRSMGQESAAVRVLIAKQDDRRRARGFGSTLLGLPYRLFVGNGYRTWWVVLWVLLATLIGSAVVDSAYDRGEIVRVKPAAEVIPFQPFVYSFDVLLPIVDLGQATSYLPIGPSSEGVRTYLWLHTCLGWLFATAVVAAAGAALRRTAP